MGFFAHLYGRTPLDNPSVWYPWFVFWPVRTIDLSLTIGEVCRRQSNVKWQYRKRDMSDDEALIVQDW
jgi:hypothetical protein